MGWTSCVDDADDRRNSDLALADARTYPQHGRAPAPLLQTRPQPAKAQPQEQESRRNRKATASGNYTPPNPDAGSNKFTTPCGDTTTTRIIVIGSASWDDRQLVRTGLIDAWKWLASKDRRRALPTVIHSSEPGAEALAVELARKLGWRIEAHPLHRHKGKRPDWIAYNRHVVSLGADYIVCFNVGNDQRITDIIFNSKGIEMALYGKPDPKAGRSRKSEKYRLKRQARKNESSKLRLFS